MTIDTRSELWKRIAALEHELEHDELTGLLNLRGLRRRVPLDQGGTGWYVYCDIDGMKAVNDTLGHAIGDKLLCAFADLLQSVTRHAPGRAPDIVAGRLHGDEFVVFVSGVDGRAGAEAIQKRLREGCMQGSDGQRVTVSTGIGDSLEKADSAMRENKRSKRTGESAR